MSNAPRTGRGAVDAPSPSQPPRLPDDVREETLGVAFFDLSRMGEWAGSAEDALVAGFLQEFYERSAALLAPAGGRIVKLMGDAGLVVFAPDAAEAVILALCDLTREARRLAAGYGLDTYLNVNVHVGRVLAGSFGPRGAERFDVIGKTVNIAARLGRRGVTLSAQAFRCLGEQARHRFEKIRQPVNYRFRG
ncbi:MAG TPA: adenylate/guanylate cyclase domain-containing protein [Phycisphaerae bacterium]|nr:adenylate/guanylate cyclase domain-containing protein [Phycisphaerae bacterium]